MPKITAKQIAELCELIVIPRDEFGRYDLSTPWLADGKTVVSDGRLILAFSGGNGLCGDGNKRPKVARDFYSPPKGLKWSDLPELPICNDCNGLGAVACNYGHKHKCKCGVGLAPPSEGDFQTFAIGNRAIATYYAARLALLPDCKWAVGSDDKHECVWLKFNGGTGKLMPVDENEGKEAA